MPAKAIPVEFESFWTPPPEGTPNAATRATRQRPERSGLHAGVAGRETDPWHELR
jgi:hypothetical protein